MESAGDAARWEKLWAKPIADEDDRLPEGQRFVAHLAITEHYLPRRLTSATPAASKASEETPWDEMTTGTSGDDWES